MLKTSTWLLLLAACTARTDATTVWGAMHHVEYFLFRMNLGIEYETETVEWRRIGGLGADGEPVKFLAPLGELSAYLSVNSSDPDLDRFSNLRHLTSEFDKLDQNNDIELDDIEAFVDREHFETAITVPTTILWTHAMEFLANHTNDSIVQLRARCELAQHTPIDILTKLEDRIYSPDSMLEVQARACQFDEVVFQKTKRMVEYRMFQLMTVEAMCRGMMFGSNATTTEDSQMKKMRTKFDRVLENIRQVDTWRKTAYWPEAAENVIKNELDHKSGHYETDVLKIARTLQKMYPWDKFFVLIFEPVMGDDMFVFSGGNNTIMLFNYADRNTVVFKGQNSGLKTSYASKKGELQTAIWNSYRSKESLNVVAEEANKIFNPPFWGFIKMIYRPSFWSSLKLTNYNLEFSYWELAAFELVPVPEERWWWHASFENSLLHITGY